MLNRIEITNYRALVDLDLPVRGINVFFGPNGVGKTTFLDSIMFLRKCNGSGVDEAAAERDQGVGLLFWNAREEADRIRIAIHLEVSIYEARFSFANGRLDTLPGESLRRSDGSPVFDRESGSVDALIHSNGSVPTAVALRNVKRLALGQYLYEEPDDPAPVAVDRFFQYGHYHDARKVFLYKLRTQGSASDTRRYLLDRADNLWSVLRNMRDRTRTEPAYELILDLMREAFPSFVDLVFEQTGPGSVYAAFVEKWAGGEVSVYPTKVSDGMIQMLIHLTALFCEPKNQYSWILFDEPETSLHPWAIAVFAKAVKLATREWGRQVFIATHSPVLLSQFEPEDLIEVSRDERGATRMRRVSEMTEIEDLVAEYAVGSLYMAGAVGPQGNPFRDVPIA